MTLWMILIAAVLIAVLVGLYFGTKKNMREGLTPPGPIDPKDQFDGFTGEPGPEIHPGESRYETDAEEMMEEGKDLGHG